MPINGIETAYKDRYTFAPLSQRAVPIQWYTLPPRFIACSRRNPTRRRKFETSQRKAIVARLNFGVQYPKFRIVLPAGLIALMV
jgi:hypothetical protein